MLDIRLMRENPKQFDEALARRGFVSDGQRIRDLDHMWRADVALTQDLQMRRNEIAKQIGGLKRQSLPTEKLQADAVEINRDLALHEAAASGHEANLMVILKGLPNLLDSDVPNGADETANVQIKQVGTLPQFDFSPKQHFELGEALGLMDFESAQRISGARFTVLRGALARLERALGQFMLDLHTIEHGYTEISPPTLVNDATLYGTAQLPKFAEDSFKTTDGRWLIPTAEVPLTNLVAGQIVPATQLPLRFTALTDCFRSEAGSAGRDTRGMLRQHQFRKVEMVSITAPDFSDTEHERMTRCAEAVLEKLGLPYRRMLLCAGDTGFASAKTYDLEVWLPGQQMWREISSCSNCRDFQGRRMNARFRGADGKVGGPVHTLNGSGVAVGRALIAVMENYQQADGSIRIPEALQDYMPGETIASKNH